MINAWAMFDWANSAYALVISVAIFPIYFLSITDDILTIGSFELPNSAALAYSISAAYIIIALITPILSGIADFSGRKKNFLKFFTYLGSFACLAMFYFNKDIDNSWMIGIITFILATIGFSGGLVFYNSYLPEISSVDKRDRVSARGFAFGYIGSVILLLFNLFMILKPSAFGIQDEYLPSRIAFLMVGLWWMGFAQILFRKLPMKKSKKITSRIVSNGYEELVKVWKYLKQRKNITRFLASFFFYSAGVQTVLYLASTFAEKELGFGATELIIVVLILQLVAIGGAYLFAFVSKKSSNKVALITMLILWIIVCLLAFFVTSKVQFYVIASMVGLVMGGIQSLSRSSYSKLIPEDTDDHASFFSFYDVLEKLAIVFGTGSFGLINQLSGGMRNSILALAVYFIIGLIILLFVSFQNKSKFKFA